MSISVKVSGAWRTVSQPAIKVSGAWRNANVVCTRIGWANRYAAKLISDTCLVSPWTVPGYAAGIDTSQPAITVEAGKTRVTWTTDADKIGVQGFALTTNLTANRTYTVTVTCVEAPAGVPWEACIFDYYGVVQLGNTVTGPGTSTAVLTTTGLYQYAKYVGIKTTPAANGTTGHLVSSITASINNPVGTVVNTSIPFPWKQVWPNPNTGALAIYGVRKEYGVSSYGWASEYIRYTQPSEPHFMNDKFQLPFVPHYRIKGDTSQVASAKVTLRFTPIAPKSPVEHTISWEAPVGWGLYHVAYAGTDGYSKYYYAALTDAEATTLRANTTRYVTQLWTPKDGGWFVWMPVCWDAAGVTVPMRADTINTSEGLDPYSGYDTFPPNRTATSALADYTVANGYSDMSNNEIVYTAITIELKNSGGTVIASWTGSLAAGNTPDQPGKGNTVAFLRERSLEDTQNYYWPYQWRGLFDNYGESSGSHNTIEFNRNLHDGSAEWVVFDEDGNLIGDFRLGMRKGIDDTIEIKGVNLKSDLVGMGIMQSIVHHGTVWCPTRYVFIEPPDPITYNVMRSWGWTKFEDWNSRNTFEAFYEVYDYEATDKYLIYDTHVPMYNRFSELGFPPPEAVVRK